MNENLKKKAMTIQRYKMAAHAVQSGVAMDHQTGSDDGSPKHLRVGVNMAMCDHAALVNILIRKGIITEEEYFDALANKAEEEQHRYEAVLSEKLGKKVTLA